MGRWSRICLRMARLRTQAEQWPPAPGVFLSPWSQTRWRTARIQAQPRNTRSKAARHTWAGGGGGAWGVVGTQDPEVRVPGPPFAPFPVPWFQAHLSYLHLSPSLKDPIPQTPALPPSLPCWNGEAECQAQVSSGLQGLSEPPKGEDPLQDGKHLEAPEEVAGGGCRGESPRGHHGCEAYLL